MEQPTRYTTDPTHRPIEAIQADLDRIRREEVATGLGEYTTRQLIDEVERRQTESDKEKA